MAIKLDEEVTLGGRRIVLVRDEIAKASRNTNAVELAKSADHHDFIFAKEEDIVAARGNWLHTPVFGVWQFALYNNLVNFADRLTVIQTAERSGLYLVCQDGRAVESGFYANNRVFDSSFDNLPSIESATVIDLTGRNLTTPKNPAVLPQERRAQEARVQRAGMVMGGAACALIAVLALGVDLMLSHQGEVRKAEAARITAEASAVSAKADALRSAIDPFTAEVRARYHAINTRGIEFVNRTKELKLVGSYADSQWTAEVSRIPVMMSFDIFTSARPGAKTTVTFSTDGTGPIDMAAIAAAAAESGAH